MKNIFSRFRTTIFNDDDQGKPDTILFAVVVCLVFIGVIALFSASLSESKSHLGGYYGYFIHQMLYGMLGGLAFGFFMYKLPFRYIKKYALLVFLGSLILTSLVWVPGVGIQEFGSHRWVDFVIFSFQPTELVKLCFIVYLAAWIETHHRNIRSLNVLVPFLVLLAILALLLILQPDFSTLMLIVIISSVIYFVAGAPWRYILSLVGGVGIVGTIAVVLEPYRFNRVLSYFNHKDDPLGIDYQINKALTAIGSGRLTGSGLTKGLQRDGSLPEPMNDSIFAVWADEVGFFGAIFLVTLFLVLFWRVLFIAHHAPTQFTALIAIGIGVWIFFQAFINIGAMVKIVPLTGMPLPYISYGSSSLIVVLGATGLLLHISKFRKR